MKLQKTILVMMFAVMLCTLPVALGARQEILRIDHLSVRSEYGDLYAPAEQPYYSTSVRVKNDYKNTLDYGDANPNFRNVKVRAYIPELGMRWSYPGFDVNEGKYYQKTYATDLDELDAEPGVYTVRYVFSDSDGNKRVKHREIVLY